MGIVKDTKEIIVLTKDIFRGINATLWGGAEKAEKAATIVKAGVSGADAVIGVSHAIEDFACKDYVCSSLSTIASISSAVGIVIGNIPSTKSLTSITGSVTVGCRLIRYYCKNYGTVWGCTVAAGHGIKETIKFVVKKNK